MRNPILENARILLVYISIWITISFFQISVLYSFYKISFIISLIDTIIYNGVFAVMVLGLWYTIRYLSLDNQSIFILVLNYIIAEFIVVSIWLFLSYGICILLLNTIEYELFSNNSLPWKVAFGILYFLAIILYYYLNIYYKSYKEKQINEANLKTLVKETELNLLRSQLNPHFIFNSLNSISSLTIIEPYKAQEMVVKLSTYMRYALKKEDKQITTLDKEIEYSRLYLEIEKVRFGDRLQCKMLVSDSTLMYTLPSMILQPLLENAIKYGVYESIGGVEILLNAYIENQFLVLKIENDFDETAIVSKGTGSGIKNTRERLYLIYQDNALFKTHKSNGRFKVTIHIPIK